MGSHFDVLDRARATFYITLTMQGIGASRFSAAIALTFASVRSYAIVTAVAKRVLLN